MTDKVFTFRSYKNFAEKIAVILVVVNFIVLMYMMLSQTTSFLPQLFNFSFSSVFTTLILLIIVYSSLNRKREVLNILADGTLEFEYPGKKKVVKTVTHLTHPYYYLLVKPAFFSDEVILILKSANGKFRMYVTLTIPKDDKAAVEAVSFALSSFKYKEMPADDKQLIDFVKTIFRPLTMSHRE